MTRHLYVVPGAAPDRFCDALAAAHDIAVQAGASYRVDYEWRRCTIFTIPNDAVPDSLPLYEEFRQGILHPVWRTYRETFGRRTLNPVSQFEKPQIIRYAPSTEAPESFHVHADSWDTSSSTRAVSVILYLNDVAEGGETDFPELDISIKPRKGTMILFPSSFTHVHQAKPPRSGPKVALVTWLHFPGDVKYACLPL